MKILVADDSATMRKIMVMTFAGEPAEVTCVASDNEALAQARQLQPDIVFVDASLEGADGYDLAQKLKSDPGCGAPAVVMLASQHNPYDTGRGQAAGVDDHVVKPFDSQVVIDKIAQLGGRSRSVGAPAASPRVAPPAPAASPARPPPPPDPGGRAPAGGQAPAPAPPGLPPRSPRSTIAFGAPPPSHPQPSAPAASATPASPASNARSNTDPVSTTTQTLSEPPSRPAPVAKTLQPQPTVGSAKTAQAISTATDGLGDRLTSMGLTSEQVQGVLALSREVVERVVWEVVPELAETLIREEIRRLTSE